MLYFDFTNNKFSEILYVYVCVGTITIRRYVKSPQHTTNCRLYIILTVEVDKCPSFGCLAQRHFGRQWFSSMFFTIPPVRKEFPCSRHRAYTSRMRKCIQSLIKHVSLIDLCHFDFGALSMSMCGLYTNSLILLFLCFMRNFCDIYFFKCHIIQLKEHFYYFTSYYLLKHFKIF